MSTTIKFSELKPNSELDFEIRPEQGFLEELAERFELISLQKVILKARLRPKGKNDWKLSGRLGASVVQSCVVTLDPVTTRIEEPFSRTFLSEWELPEEAEAEMPEDETLEPIPEVLDLLQMLSEVLALVIPPYPRKEGVELETSQFSAPGIAPMTDDDAKPFAGLAELKSKFEN